MVYLGAGRADGVGLALLGVIDSPTKGFLEILSGVLVARAVGGGGYLSRMGTDESCSGFALMYFGKRKAGRTNLFLSR